MCLLKNISVKNIRVKNDNPTLVANGIIDTSANTAEHNWALLQISCYFLSLVQTDLTDRQFAIRVADMLDIMYTFTVIVVDSFSMGLGVLY